VRESNVALQRLRAGAKFYLVTLTVACDEPEHGYRVLIATAGSFAGGQYGAAPWPVESSTSRSS